MSNPFELKIYYIRESPLTKCSSLSSPSRITIKNGNIQGILSNKNNDVKGFYSKGPLSLLEVKQYLSDETTKFYIQAELAKTCDSVGMKLNDNAEAKVSSIPPACSSTFTNYSARNLRMIQAAIDKKSTAYTTQMFSGKNPFMNFDYTPQFIDSHKTYNDKKQLCQRYDDIGQLLTDFLAILTVYNNNPQKKAFKDKYNEMIEIYKSNGQLRAELKNKLDNLTQGIYYNDSKEFLDSTVYVNVLWTILATTGVFYLFKSFNK
jgi:hypothetical protein